MRTGTQVVSNLPISAVDFAEPEPHTPPEPSIGSILGGKYRLETVIGRGGMGVVYRAAHLRSGRIVAVKWLLADDVDTRERFLREARALGSIAHPNVVSILDVGSHDGKEFLVMEFIEGKSLRAHVNDGGRRLTTRESVELLLPALSGLAAVHRAGFVHRDIKPDNLFVCLDRDGAAYDVKVLDFGVVRRGVRAEGEYATLAGYCVGTPRYMAPEQFRADPNVDARADVYAVGVILHELVTGASPMRAESRHLLPAGQEDVDTARKVATEIPDDLVRLLDRMLSWDRESRFRDATALGRALASTFPGLRFVEPRDVHISRGPEMSLGLALESDPAFALPPTTSEFARADAPTPKPARATTAGTAAIEATVESPRAAQPARRFASAILVTTLTVLAGIAFAFDGRAPSTSASPQPRREIAAAPASIEPPSGTSPPAPVPVAAAAPDERAPEVEPAELPARRRDPVTPAVRSPRVVHGRSGTLRADEF